MGTKARARAVREGDVARARSRLPGASAWAGGPCDLSDEGLGGNGTAEQRLHDVSRRALQPVAIQHLADPWGPTRVAVDPRASRPPDGGSDRRREHRPRRVVRHVARLLDE